MTKREQKIEALADSVYPKMHPAWDGEQRIAYVDGILAGIALRDAELLERLGTFDASAAIRAWNKDFGKGDSLLYLDGARWQHEQFMKAIKGDGDA